MLKRLLFVFVLALPMSVSAQSSILVFGDSLSAGYGIAVEQSWPALLARRLQNNRPPWSVSNASISGETTAGGRSRFVAALDRAQPAVVVLALGANDGLRGLRSGFVAGDAAILKNFLLYRTYHGSAMNPAVQAASIAAWNDEAHVRANRRLYAEKFHEVTPLVARHLDCRIPDAGFYLWARTPIADTDFARELLRQKNVVVLPGSYLARDNAGANPGAGFIRIALVAGHEECREAAARINDFCQSL